MLLGREKEIILHLPTPIEYLPAISAELGIELYIKRDDLTPLAMGGNKLRKLEYLLKEAQEQSATMLLTLGGVQTNHGRLTLAVARKYGLKGSIVCVGDYPGELSANLLLDGIMGCDVWIKGSEAGKSDSQVYDEILPGIIESYESQGEKVYFIPIGGSNELGALGYYECAQEIAAQIAGTALEGARIIDAVGSMGTYMGLFSAIINEELPLKLTGISIMPYADIKSTALSYYDRMRDRYGLSRQASGEDLELVTAYDRGAYNNACHEVRQAIYYMAEKEAIILDPCYTGKAFSGLLEMVRKGEIRQGEKVIFLHTGGAPGINTPHHRIEFEKEREHFIHVL